MMFDGVLDKTAAELPAFENDVEEVDEEEVFAPLFPPLPSCAPHPSLLMMSFLIVSSVFGIIMSLIESVGLIDFAGRPRIDNVSCKLGS